MMSGLQIQGQCRKGRDPSRSDLGQTGIERSDEQRGLQHKVLSDLSDLSYLFRRLIEKRPRRLKREGEISNKEVPKRAR
jgi:hypothetical protein